MNDNKRAVSNLICLNIENLRCNKLIYIQEVQEGDISIKFAVLRLEPTIKPCWIPVVLSFLFDFLCLCVCHFFSEHY